MNAVVNGMVRCIVSAAVICSASAADAGLFRAYLSFNGSDANPCTVQQPCRLLPAALSVINDGGEIWILDSANYNVSTVVVGKSVTILAIPGAVGSLVATTSGGGDGAALLIGGAGIKVTLRNLVFVPFGTNTDGIQFVQGAAFNVEDCEVSNMAGSGIAVFNTSTNVTLKNTVLRDNATGFYARGLSGAPVKAVLDGVHVEGNSGVGAWADSSSDVTVRNSVLAHNAVGARSSAFNGPTGPTAMTVSHTAVASNGNGLEVQASAGSGAAMIADANVVTNSNTAFFFAGGGGSEQIVTLQNNTVIANTAIISGGALSANSVM